MQSRLLDARACGSNARQYDPSLWLFEKDSDRALTCRFVADVVAIGAATRRHAFVLSVALFFHFILGNVDHSDSGSLACDEAEGGEGNNEDYLSHLRSPLEKTIRPTAPAEILSWQPSSYCVSPHYLYEKQLSLPKMTRLVSDSKAR